VFFADRIATVDATVVRRLRAAGADVVATLNLAEFAVGVTSQNSASGGPVNPWDPRRVPGGSSGGSAAAVAAGLVDLALGTDTGGSVRLPASACGVVGLRPSLGLIDNTGVFPVSSGFDTVGPIARSAELVARAFSVIAAVRRPSQIAAPHPRLGVPVDFANVTVDPPIAQAVDGFVRSMTKLGCRVAPVVIDGANQAQEHVYTLVYSDLAEVHRGRLEHRPDLFQPATLERIRSGLSITPEQRQAAREACRHYRRGLAQVFEEVDVIVTPTLPVDVPMRDETTTVIEQSRHMGQMSYPWSLHDGPTLSLPVGFHPFSGMPIGAQITAAHGREQVLFDVAQAYQGVTDWHQRRPLLSL